MGKDRDTIKRSLTDYYDDGAAGYNDLHYIREQPYSPLKFRQFYIEQMIEALSLPKGAKILDVGCGPGQLVLSLSRRGYQAWGIDISRSMVDQAKALIDSQGIGAHDQVMVGDIEELRFDDEFFDVVVASGVIEYQKNDDVSLREMRRVLRPGGALILNVTARVSYTGLLEAGYAALKKIDVVRSVLNGVKDGIFKRGPVIVVPARRTHSPRKFDRTLENYGFRKLDHRYFHFAPLPIPLDFPFASIGKSAGKWMERFSHTSLGPLGRGYIVMATKSES
jgi:ubiquinone/menaquinone biosynthesis C-methylase UbiE